MKILLINNNPVVSRLTALSARKEDIEIDEIQEVTELHSGTYDIVFVDADSWTKDVRDVISEDIKTQKLVLFYSDGDEEEKFSFDLSILKPFLPSEVSAVIRSLEEKSLESVTLENKESHFNILNNTKKIDDEDELFDLGGLDEVTEKKEEIALDTDNRMDLEVEDLSFDDKLEELFPLKLNALDDDLVEDKLHIEKSIENKDDDIFDLDLSDEITSLEDDLFTDDKKEETLDAMDELEIEEVKKETQVLDEVEIENIKSILIEDSSDDMVLEDLIPAMAVMPTVEEVKEKEEVDSNELDIDSNVLSQTLAAMPVENLRQLLAGSKINIKIKFPKSK
jgi:hypothetical protein